MGWAMTTARRDDNHLSFCDLVRLILEILRYLKCTFSGYTATQSQHGDIRAASPMGHCNCNCHKNTSFCPCVCLSGVCLSHIIHDVSVIVSSWNFQDLLPLTKVMSMQEVKVRGQSHRGQNPIQPFPDCNSSLNSHMATEWCTKLEVA